VKIFWDLDGVLRDLISVVGHNPQHYHEKIDGLGFVEYVTKHKHLLVSAPTTEYFSLVKGKAITVITCQPLDWIPYTNEWLKNHLPKAKTIFCQHPLAKMEYMKDGCLLIEDYPEFPDNSRIIMVDRPYNRNVEGCHARVYTPAELKYALKEVWLCQEYHGAQKKRTS
jgi:hypothetical protein